MSFVAGIRKKEVDALLLKFCEYYGVTLDMLLQTRKGRGAGDSVWKWKRFLVIILYDYYDLDFTEIQSVLGYKSYNGVYGNYQILKEELSDALYGSDKVKLSFNKLLKYLQL